ncbi:MAG: peptidylprolyl isomerase, partial [Acidobacteriota bacterium]
WRLRNLFLRFGSDEPSIARDRLRDLRRRVLDGASFEALAREHSQSETRWRGGLLGNVRLGTFPPTVDEVIRALKPGDVSDVLESADGVTLLYCERILEPITKTAEDVRRQAAHRLHRRHYDRDLAALRETLRAKADKQRIEGPVGPSIRFTGALLDPESLSAVIGRDADAAWSDVWPPAWHEALDRFVVGRMALLHEAERGLGPDADTRSTLRWEARRILASTLLAEEARPRFVEPTEEDLRRAFEIDAASYRLGSSVDLQVVRLPRSETADAVRILTDLRNGELMFDDAARHHSSDPSAERGGRLDGLAVSRIAPRLGLDVARAVRELATGEISELIWAEDALWIVRLQARHPERAPTYDEARRDVRRRWIRDALDRIRDELVARRLDALDIR